jgi:hypothetical protein
MYLFQPMLFLHIAILMSSSSVFCAEHNKANETVMGEPVLKSIKNKKNTLITSY